MIVGIGNDIIEIQRIQRVVETNPRFLLKNFTSKEQTYFKKRNYSYESIAGNFAAKEAVSKALGTGFSGFGAIDIEITRNKKGGPVVFLHGKAKEIAKEKGITTIWVSISHCKVYATAYSIAEKGL